MSKERRASGPSLHLEWSPGQVQAVDIATVQRWMGTGLKDLPPSLVGQHREAIVGVRRNLIFLKCVSLPKAAPEDLRRILAVQIGQLFPLPSDQLAFDFVQTHEQTQDGYLTMVAAIRAEDLRQLRTDLQAAGIRATRILPVALGSPAVAARAGRKDALVIENGTLGYTLDVVKDGIVRLSRTASLGSDLAAEARRTLAAANVGELPVVAVGGGTMPRGDVIAATSTALEELQEAPAFSFELEEDRIREAQRRVTARTRLSALMMLSALLLVALVWADRSDAQAMLLRGQGAWARELGKQRSIRDTEVSKEQKVVEQETGLKTAFVTAQPLADIASVIGDSLPSSSWLTGLNIERGKMVQIRGTTSNPDDVARFLRALSDSGRFRDIKLVVANTAKINTTTVVQFNVTAVAIGNLPMPAPQKLVPGRARAATSNSGSASGTESSAGSAAGGG